MKSSVNLSRKLIHQNSNTLQFQPKNLSHLMLFLVNAFLSFSQFSSFTEDLYNLKENKKKMEKYEITTRSKKAEKQYYNVLNSEQGISGKLERLKENPRTELDAHKLKGIRLAAKRLS